MRHIRPLSAVSIAAVLLLASPGRAQEPTERSLAVPTGWYWYTGMSAADLTALMQDLNARIVDIEVETANPLRFAAALVHASGPYNKASWWYPALTSAQVVTQASALDARILDLEPYVVEDQIRYAVVYVPNTGADAEVWWTLLNTSEAAIGAFAASHDARIVDLDTFKVGNDRSWSAVFVKNSGPEAIHWWWNTGLDLDGLRHRAANLHARPFNIERYVEGEQVLYAALFLPDTGRFARDWWWQFGLSSSEVGDFANEKSARVIDVESYNVIISIQPLRIARRYDVLYIGNSFPPPRFVRGDANTDHKIDISDPRSILNFLFLGGAPTTCDDAADANDDGRIDISDASTLLGFLFLGGSLSLPPGVSPGDLQVDTTEDDLGCDVYSRILEL